MKIHHAMVEWQGVRFYKNRGNWFNFDPVFKGSGTNHLITSPTLCQRLDKCLSHQKQ